MCVDASNSKYAVARGAVWRHKTPVWVTQSPHTSGQTANREAGIIFVADSPETPQASAGVDGSS